MKTMISNLWNVLREYIGALCLVAVMCLIYWALCLAAFSAEFTTPTRFSANVVLERWTNAATIAQATNTSAGASTATGTFSYAVQATNSTGTGIMSAGSNASFTATGQLIRIAWNPVGGATGYRVWRGLTNYVSVGSVTQFIDYGTNTWTAAAPSTSAVMPTLYIGTNQVATLADITAGTVTNGQWWPDTARIGLLATGTSVRVVALDQQAGADNTNKVDHARYALWSAGVAGGNYDGTNIPVAGLSIGGDGYLYVYANGITTTPTDVYISTLIRKDGSALQSNDVFRYFPASPGFNAGFYPAPASSLAGPGLNALANGQLEVTNSPTGGGGWPLTNDANVAGYGLTNIGRVNFAAPTNYQWICSIGTNLLEAILVNASGGVTGYVRRVGGIDYVVAP